MGVADDFAGHLRSDDPEDHGYLAEHPEEDGSESQGGFGSLLGSGFGLCFHAVTPVRNCQKYTAHLAQEKGESRKTDRFPSIVRQWRVTNVRSEP